jgi:formylglycine-generating enzyme required for sulfatase activity
MLGTPDYIAPEQIRDAQSADIRADIHSLGCTFYYLLTGGPPFRGDHLWDLYQAHFSMEAGPLNLVRPEVPVELAAVVAKMMAKEPGRRFQSPGEVAQALAPFFKTGSVGARLSDVQVSQVREMEGRPESPAKGSVRTGSATNLEPAAASVVKKTAAKARPEPQWESPIELKETEPAKEPAPDFALLNRQIPRWLRPAVAAGVLVLGLVALWGVTLRVKTANGMIELVNLPKDAEVLVDGAEVAVTWPGGGKPAVITVTAGSHNIMVKKNGTEISGEDVTVQADGKEKFSVRFVASTKPSHELPKDDGADSTRTARKDIRSDAGPAVKTSTSQDSITNSIGMTLKRIPAGEFMMSSLDSDNDARNDEKPQHRLRISKSFYLGVYEVTQAQYKAVMGNNPSYFSPNGGGKDKVAGQSTDQYPVDSVSWFDAVIFCNKLCAKEGRRPFYEIDDKYVRVPDRNGPGFRLPTEAEWEYACRANASTRTRYSFEDDWAQLDEYGWFQANSSRIRPVGQKRPNGFGLYDMHGNVAERCWDWYGEGYYKQSREDDPTGPAVRVGPSRVNRGGSWDQGPHIARSADRGGGVEQPNNGYFNMGFRLALGQSGR